MSRRLTPIVISAVGLMLALPLACGRPDKGIPPEPTPRVVIEEEPTAQPTPEPTPVADLPAPVVETPDAPKQAAPNLRAALGRFKITYYWIANEDKESKGTTPIVDSSCQRIARVSKSFRRRLQLEGSGRLKDGRMINRAGGCKCDGACYWVTGEEHQWGAGVGNRALKPFRSIAVDPKQVKIGTSLYVAELDGLTMPGAGAEGGFVHDGCVVADDRGGGVRGMQIDLFAARREHYYDFFSPNKITRVSVFKGGKRCSADSRAGAPVRGVSSSAI